MVKPNRESNTEMGASANEKNYDELLDDDEEEDVELQEYANEARAMTDAGLDVGKFLRSREGEMQMNYTEPEEGEGSFSYRKELDNIFNVLTRSRKELDADSGISDAIRDNFKEYKNHMEDITVGKDKGVYKRILQPGVGGQASFGKIVKYHYALQIENQDEPFDSSLARGRMQKSKLGDGKSIPGLELGLSTMKEGELADFVIDCKYAFGVCGCPPRIPESCTIRATVRLWECVDEDSVDAMTLEKRRELSAKDSIEYIHRKLENGKKSFGRGKFNAAINRYKDARLQAEMENDMWSEAEKSEILELRIRLYKNLATCYVKISMPKKALIYLKKLDEAGIRDAKTHFMWAKVYCSEGNYDKALDELQAARALEPGSTDIAKLIAQVKKEKGEYEQNFKAECKRMFSSPTKGGGDTTGTQ